MGVTLKMRRYRAVISAFLRYHGDPSLVEVRKQYDFDLMQNHSTRTSLEKYGLEAESIAGTDDRHIIGCIKTCIHWHATINICQDQPLYIDKDDRGGALQDQAVSIATTSLSPTELTKLANSITNAGRHFQEQTTRDVLSSIVADCVRLYFPPLPPPQPSAAMQQRSRYLVHPRRIGDLRRFLGDEKASFRFPEQGELVERMQARKDHILAILPCGAGKTFMVLFQAMAYEPCQTTILILPLSGLQADFCRRAEQVGCVVDQWKPNGKFNAQATVLYVSIEHASFASFLR
jgi:superfamily II DNA helicase RecQ